jgi:hypothetical protein
MNAFQPEPEQPSVDAPYGGADLDTLRYNELASLLKCSAADKSGFYPTQLCDNLTSLSAATSSPRVISFLWLCASEAIRSKSSKLKRHAGLFEDFWDAHKRDIKDFLSNAPLDFLSINSQYLGQSLFETNNIRRILSERLLILKEDVTPDDTDNLLRVYRGLRLMPPYELLENIPKIEIQSHRDLVKYIYLIHSISRAGLSIANTELMDPLKQIYPLYIEKLFPRDRNSLLWSVTAQFAFAHDGGIEMNASLYNSYCYLLDDLKPYTKNNIELSQIFNMTAILLETESMDTKYANSDHSSHSEYKFMRDFREYGLTREDRTNLKRDNITNHVGRLQREVDGHYIIGNQPVIIEFDGEFHYRESLMGHGDEPNGSTKLQTHILQKLFPDHVIIRLHYKLGNSFTALPDDEKADTFAKFREYISYLSPDAYYLDLHNGQLRAQTARALQLRHNNENGITRQPTQI